MSEPYYPDSQDDDQDEQMQFDQFGRADDEETYPPPRAQGKGSQPEWQSSNPNTQQDQWGQQRDRMHAPDPDGDPRRAADQGGQPNSQYPHAAPDDMDDDADDWPDNTSTR